MPGYRGYHARNGLARSRRLPRRSEIVRAIPDGCRRIRGRRAGQDLADGLAMMPEFAALRSHARANMLAIVADLCSPDHLQYRHGLTIDPRDGLCARLGIALETWKAHRRRMGAWHVLRTVTEGCIYWHGEESRSDAAIYVICLPRGILRKLAAARKAARRRDKTRPPTVEPKVVEPAGRPALSTGGKAERGPPSGRPGLLASPRNAGLAAGSPAGRAMADVIRDAGGPDLTDGWCGHIARPYLAAGWTPGDMQHAVTHMSLDGEFTDAVIKIRRRQVLQAWLAAFWLDDEGLPREPPSPRKAAAAAGLRERQAAERADAAARAAAAVDPGPRVAAIFAEQGWTRPKPRAGPEGKDP